MKIKLRKRGLNLWISWVLLLAMVVLISGLTAGWLISQTQDEKDILVEKGKQISCNLVGLSITSACQDSEKAELTIKNTKQLEINKVKVRLIDLYGQVDEKTKIIDLEPGQSKNLIVYKADATYRIEVVPFIEEGQTICREQMSYWEEVESC